MYTFHERIKHNRKGNIVENHLETEESITKTQDKVFLIVAFRYLKCISGSQKPCENNKEGNATQKLCQKKIFFSPFFKGLTGTKLDVCCKRERILICFSFLHRDHRHQWRSLLQGFCWELIQAM